MKVLPGGVIGLIFGWIPSFLWAIYIHWLLCTPGRGVKMPLMLSYAYNLGHAILFGILAVLLLFSFSFSGIKGIRLFWAAFFVSFFWSIIEEIFQAGIPERNASIPDILTSMFGAGFFLLLVFDILSKGKLSKLNLFFFVCILVSASIATFL